MEQMNYKSEIEQSRIGSLGSSDAALVARVGQGGIEALTDTDKFRLAVLKGQERRVDFKTPAMELGDKIEQTIFDILKSKHPEAVSNPQHEDVQMSAYYGFGIINHIDVEIVSPDKVVWYEIKASKYDTAEALKTYQDQLQWHWMLLRKVAKDIDTELYLVHYQTGKTQEFAASNLSIVPVEADDTRISLFYEGFIRLREYLPTFVYSKPEEQSIRLVNDDEVQQLREQAEQAIPLVVELQKKIDAFKAALLNYMQENSIKKIYSDTYSVTLTNASVATTFDSKRFQSEQPELYKEYLKQTERKASVTIRVK